MSYQSKMEVHYTVTYSDGGADVRAEAHNEDGLYFSNDETISIGDPCECLAHHAAYNEPREWSRTAYMTDAGVRVQDSNGAWVPYHTELKKVVEEVTAELDAVVGSWDMEDPS